MAYRGSLADRPEDIGREVVDAAYRVHSALGPGLLESIYETWLCHDLQKRGFLVDKQVAMPIVDDTLRLGSGLRLDLLVEKSVVVEVKSVARTIPVYQAQILGYLKLADLNLGFLIDFNVPQRRDGLKRAAR